VDTNLSWPLERAAGLYGDAVAVQAGSRSISYGELARRAGAVGTALDDLGVPVGARVGFLGLNSIAHFESWLAVPAAGRVLTDLNFRLAPAELSFLVNDSELEILIVDESNLGRALELRATCPSLRLIVLDTAEVAVPQGDVIGYEWMTGHEPSAPRVAGAEQLAAISYTGGTTGRPKGVMLSHGNLAANALHNVLITGHSPDDTFLHVCPMFHAAGVANVFASTWVGARQVVLPRFDPQAVCDAIESERVTLTTLVPTMIGMLLDHLERHPADLCSLRNLHYAASPIAPELQARLLATLDCEIAQMYGMTEAAPTVTHLSPAVHRRGASGHEPDRTRLRSMGIPIVGVRAEVRDPDGRCAAPGEVGEVWVAGPNVMQGYWNAPEATAAAVVDGWYRSGDAAYRDADGYLFMVDRLKDMIITGGENVYSVEVENVLVDHPAVAEAAVFGVPDPRWGERVHAVVVVAPARDVDVEELRAHCRERVAGFKVPRSIDFRSEPLPKSGAGKVLKADMRNAFWSEVERGVS
jgi:long-chain acyl-CoA synthetase